jgi:CBS domain-containing protein
MGADKSRTTPTQLSEIMSTELVTLDPDETLREAVTLFADHDISGAPVVAAGQLVGVISTTDIIAVEASSPGVPAEQPQHANWGDRDEPTEWVEGEEPPPAYFLELWDDAGPPVDVRVAETFGPEWDTLAEHTVAEAMTRTILSLPPATTVEEAARFMADHRIHRLLVMDGERLVGWVTSTDVLDAVGERVEPAARASAPRQEATTDQVSPLEQESSTGGFVIGPTDRGSDIGFRPRGVLGLDEW